MQKEKQPIRFLNAEVVRGLLKKDDLPPGLSQNILRGEIKKMARAARMKMSTNECGGLPGPLVKTPSLMRKFIKYLEKQAEKDQYISP